MPDNNPVLPADYTSVVPYIPTPLPPAALAWAAMHPKEIFWITGVLSSFARFCRQALVENGRLTHAQLQAVQRQLAEEAQRAINEARYTCVLPTREAIEERAGPGYPLAPIPAIYEFYFSPSIRRVHTATRPVTLRLGALSVQLDPKSYDPGSRGAKAHAWHGTGPKARYIGYFRFGEFRTYHEATQADTALALAVAANPLAAAREFSKRTRACYVCGRKFYRFEAQLITCNAHAGLLLN